MDVFDLFNIIVGGTIVCINGFWDDLKMINPYQKILYQLIAVIFIIYNNELVVQNLHGFLGIEVYSILAGLWIHYIYRGFHDQCFQFNRWN